MQALQLKPGQRRSLLIAAAILFVETIFYVGVLPLLPVYADRYELSSVGAGVIVGAYSAGVVVGSLLTAIIGGRTEFRRLAASGLCILAVSTALFAFAEQIVVLDLARLFQGVGAGFAWVGALGWIASIAPANRRGTVMGVVMSTAVIGAILGPLVGALAVTTSVEVVFGLLALVQGALGLAVLREGGIRDSSDAEPKVAGPPPKARAVALSLVALPAILAGIYEALTPLQLDAAGAGTGLIAAVFVVGAAVEAVAGPLTGRLSDDTGRLPPLRVALAIAPLACLASTAATGKTVLVILAVLAWLAITSAWTPGLALVADLSGGAGRRAASDWAVLNVVLAGGVLVGSIAGPTLAEHFGQGVPYAVAGLGCAIAIIAAGRSQEHLTRDPIPCA